MLDLMLAKGIKNIEDEKQMIRLYNETGLSPFDELNDFSKR